eukprot:TRINITY_DN3759_c0_g2_i6.p3 TRINITY_DN3759_c0_g2~~TRINITY_DN3759_c0_g2_i6.p3  ORF type:complete len:146 (+),score=19.11 TRINITY_DN3759_c0_g2_i6:979-1416(+)
MAALLFISWFKGLWAHRWRWFDSHSCGQWKTYLNSMVSIGFLIYLDWLAFEIFTIQASRLRNSTDLAGQAVIANTYALIYMIPYGVQTTTNALVGNAIGEGNKKKAIAYRYMGSSTISFKPASSYHCSLASGMSGPDSSLRKRTL